MFHVFAFTYYILLCCVMCEYSMTSVLLRYDITIPFAIYRFHMAHNARVHYEKLLNLRDVRVHYYYSLLERYMKHVFVASLVTGDFLTMFYIKWFGLYWGAFQVFSYQNLQTRVVILYIKYDNTEDKKGFKINLYLKVF